MFELGYGKQKKGVKCARFFILGEVAETLSAKHTSQVIRILRFVPKEKESTSRAMRVDRIKRAKI